MMIFVDGNQQLNQAVVFIGIIVNSDDTSSVVSVVQTQKNELGFISVLVKAWTD